MINNHMQSDLAAGVIGNFFKSDQLDSIREIMLKLDTTEPKAGGRCYGIDKKNKAYPWFSKAVMQPLRNKFHPRLDLIYGMLLHSTNPFAVHADHFATPTPGEQYKSFLVPINVDGDPDLCSGSKTIIFNQIDLLNQLSPNPNGSQLPKLPPDISAIEIWKNDLTHIPLETAEVLSVKLNATWHRGDLIFWDSLLLHTSSDFKSKGHAHKECVVIHTYIPD